MRVQYNKLQKTTTSHYASKLWVVRCWELLSKIVLKFEHEVPPCLQPDMPALKNIFFEGIAAICTSIQVSNTADLALSSHSLMTPATHAWTKCNGMESLRLLSQHMRLILLRWGPHSRFTGEGRPPLVRLYQYHNQDDGKPYADKCEAVIHSTRPSVRCCDQQGHARGNVIGMRLVLLRRQELVLPFCTICSPECKGPWAASSFVREMKFDTRICFGFSCRLVSVL